jgi:hypothetical protein
MATPKFAGSSITLPDSDCVFDPTSLREPSTYTFALPQRRPKYSIRPRYWFVGVTRDNLHCGASRGPSPLHMHSTPAPAESCITPIKKKHEAYVVTNPLILATATVLKGLAVSNRVRSL